ncbi:MAG: dihydroorotase [Oligoflexia bacterium]|nr:dihydroorotase [Oligoflexia bacterium]
MSGKNKNNFSLLVKNGTIIDPEKKFSNKADLYIYEGKIHGYDKPGSFNQKAKNDKAEILDAEGSFVSAGFVDLHCTIHEPGAEHVESILTASHAAAAGGFTTVVMSPDTNPIIDNAFMVDFVQRKVKESALVNVLVMGALSSGCKGEKLAEIGSMLEAGAVAIGDSKNIADSYLMRKALEYSNSLGATVFSFPEDETLAGKGVMNEGLNSNRLGLRGIPSAAEEIQVSRDLILAKHTKSKIHIQSISTSGSLEIIERAKESGVLASCETNPQYFHLTSDSISTYDSNYKVYPPLRSDKDVEAIIQALSSGVIDLVSSAHYPVSKSNKELTFEFAQAGMINLQTTFSLMIDLVNKKKLNPIRMIELLTKSPAKLIGKSEEVGSLKKGARGDLVIFQPKKKWQFSEKNLFGSSKNSPFLGRTMNGVVEYTIANGKIVYSEKVGIQ